MNTTAQKIPSGYKQTDIGVIPTDWSVSRLGDYLARRPRYGIGAAAVEYSDRLPKYIRITDISEDGRYLPDKLVSVDNLFSANYFLSEGDLVVARTGASVGKSYLYKPKDGPLVFAGFLICLTPNKDRLLPEYLNAYLKTTSYWDWVRLTSMRSGQPGINGNEYAQLMIPVPEIDEQRLIGEALADTDALIEKTENLIEKKKNVKRGVMQELFTGKRRLPGFSNKWLVKEMGEIGKTYGGLAGKIKDDFGTGNSVYIPFMNIMSNPVIDPGYLDTVNIRPGEYQNKAQRGDLFFNGSSETPEEVGLCSVLLTDVPNLYLNSFCFGLRLNPELETDGLFFSYYFRSDAGRQLIFSLAQGATRYNLSKSNFLKLRVPYPEPAEQTAIATTLSDMDAEIEKLKSQLAKYQNIKQGMMQSLLTGKIRLLAK